MIADVDRPEPAPPKTFRAAVHVFFRYASPRLLSALAVAAVAWRVALGGWTWADLVLAGAIAAFWPIQEWLIHVCLLHWKPRTVLGVRIDPRNARKHRAHHREPRLISLVFVPLHSHAIVFPVLLLGAHLLLPTAALAGTVVATFLVLALHYEWCHYLAHVPYTPRLYRALCRDHMLHHFKSEKHWYGVSMRAGDLLLGTRADPKTLPTSETVKTLGIAA